MLIANSKAIFLDRDGTINKEKHYMFRKEDFEYIDGCVEGLKILYEAGFLLVVITNQSGIARGYYTEMDYLLLDNWMQNDFLKKGIEIAGSYYCPHLQEGIISRYAKDCNCRKPKTGLFWKAQEELGIDMNRSYAIGDNIRDLSICNESGVKGILLSDSIAEEFNFIRCKTWNDAINVIVGKHN